MKFVDIAVSDREQKLQLVVEIKSKLGASAEWVIRMRRNLLAHSFMPNAPFFLLVLPDSLYLWTDANLVDGTARPDYKIEATEVLAPYLKSNQTVNDLSGYGLELLTISWLEDVIGNDMQRDSVNPNIKWIFDSGLYEAIRHGSVELEAAT